MALPHVIFCRASCLVCRSHSWEHDGADDTFSCELVAACSGCVSQQRHTLWHALRHRQGSLSLPLSLNPFVCVSLCVCLSLCMCIGVVCGCIAVIVWYIVLWVGVIVIYYFVLHYPLHYWYRHRDLMWLFSLLSSLIVSPLFTSLCTLFSHTLRHSACDIPLRVPCWPALDLLLHSAQLCLHCLAPAAGGDCCTVAKREGQRCYVYLSGWAWRMPCRYVIKTRGNFDTALLDVCW